MRELHDECGVDFKQRWLRIANFNGLTPDGSFKRNYLGVHRLRLDLALRPNCAAFADRSVLRPRNILVRVAVLS